MLRGGPGQRRSQRRAGGVRGEAARPSTKESDPRMSRSDELEGAGREDPEGRARRSTTRRTPPPASCSAASASRCCSTTAARTSSRTACSPTTAPPICPPTASSPALGKHPRPPGRDHGQRLDGEGRLVGRAHRREDRAHPGDGRAAAACRSSTWSTRPARASPIRSTCSPAAATPGASSTTRCTCRARCRRSACCSARRRRAAPTSRRSATWCSWSTRTRRCTSARRAWPRW